MIFRNNTAPKKFSLELLSLHLVLILTFAILAVVFLLTLVGKKIDLDFSHFQNILPFSDQVTDVPLLSITASHIGSSFGPIERARFVVTATLFFYVFALSLTPIAVASWVKKDLLNSHSVSPQLFYWLAFIFLSCLTLLFFPLQTWGRNSLAYRWAVQSDLRYLLLALMIGGTNLFVAFAATFLNSKLSNK
jgi:hypothetical protein